MDENCLFCKIINGDIPSSKVYEDEYVLCFNDINPIAKVHVLVIPKIHIKDVEHITSENEIYLTKCFEAIKKVTKITDICDSGYRVISNIGKDGGQEVPHLHFHVIGGEKLSNKMA